MLDTIRKFYDFLFNVSFMWLSNGWSMIAMIDFFPAGGGEGLDTVYIGRNP